MRRSRREVHRMLVIDAGAETLTESVSAVAMLVYLLHVLYNMLPDLVLDNQSPAKAVPGVPDNRLSRRYTISHCPHVRIANGTVE